MQTTSGCPVASRKRVCVCWPGARGRCAEWADGQPCRRRDQGSPRRHGYQWRSASAAKLFRRSSTTHPGALFVGARSQVHVGRAYRWGLLSMASRDGHGVISDVSRRWWRLTDAGDTASGTMRVIAPPVRHPGSPGATPNHDLAVLSTWQDEMWIQVPVFGKGGSQEMDE